MERLTYKEKDGSYNSKKSYYILANKLAGYEDLEEQDLLLRLPCKVGDVVYALLVDEEKFEHFHCGVKIKKLDFDFWMIPLLGKTVFLTQAEADEALRSMKEREEKANE